MLGAPCGKESVVSISVSQHLARAQDRESTQYAMSGEILRKSYFVVSSLITTKDNSNLMMTMARHCAEHYICMILGNPQNLWKCTMSIPILQIRELKLRVSNSNRAKIEPRLPDSRDHYLKQTVVISSLLVPNAITLAVLAAVHGKAASPVVGSLPLHKAEQF